jgi:hypothetical protein
LFVQFRAPIKRRGEVPQPTTVAMEGINAKSAEFRRDAKAASPSPVKPCTVDGFQQLGVT